MTHFAANNRKSSCYWPEEAPRRTRQVQATQHGSAGSLQTRTHHPLAAAPKPPMCQKRPRPRNLLSDTNLRCCLTDDSTLRVYA